ncbi:MAG TPA: hypothetical protein DCS93_24170 [Microscillaceae bacterium]|nr:hypothetical protein [Microscillaceae bacterium]
MTKKRQFNAQQILEQLPVNYHLMSKQVHDLTKTDFNRTATFDNLQAGSQECYFFYKPISRLIQLENEKNI